MNWRSRGSSAISLLCAGLMVVHELRYALAGESTSFSGVHAYLGVVGPLVGMSLVATLALFGRAAVRASTGRRVRVSHAHLRFTHLWAAAALILIASFYVQESAEQIFSGGSPSRALLIGHGGWIAPLIAVLVGATIALLLRGAESVLELFAARPRQATHSRAVNARPPIAHAPQAGSLLATNLAGRAPPLRA